MTETSEDRWLWRQQLRAFRLACQLIGLSPLILFVVRLGELQAPGWIAMLVLPATTLALYQAVSRGWIAHSSASAALLVGLTVTVTASHAYLPLARHILSVTGVLLVFASLTLSARGFVAFAVFQLVLVLFSRPLRVANGLPAPGAGVFFLDLGLAHLGLSAALWALDRQFHRSREHLEQGIERARLAGEAALAASNGKLAFLAQMSHELRTPLNAILGYSEMLAEDRTGPARADLERIQLAGRELLGQIGDVLRTAADAEGLSDTSQPGAPEEERLTLLERLPVVTSMFAVACIIVFAPTGFDTAGYGVLAMTLAAALYPRRAFRREVLPWMFGGLGMASLIRLAQGLSSIADVAMPMVAMAAMAFPLAMAVEQRGAMRERLVLERLRAQRSEERAHAHDEARTRFLRTSSVDIRTPLATIVGYAELLADEIDEPEVLEDLSRIERAAGHLQEIVGDVLDIATEEVDAATLGPVELVPCCERAIDLCRPTIEGNGNELRVVLAEACCTLGDDRMIVQILVNLLGNAGKYTRDGRIELELARHTERVVVSVRDTGEGIPPDELEQVFQPFHRLASSSSAVGAGLGLALARQMARSLGGDLTVSSQVGVGSTFSLMLPAQQVALSPR